MKKLLIIFLFALVNSLVSMDADQSENVKRARDCDEICDGSHVLKSRKTSDGECPRICVRTSDGIEVGLSKRELAKLDSALLDGLLEEFSFASEVIPLHNVNEKTLLFIKRLINEDDRLLVLESYDDDWTYLIEALAYLDSSKWLDFVCKWKSFHIDFSTFDGSNVFPQLIKEGRFVKSLHGALYERLCSDVEFYDLRKVGDKDGALLYVDEAVYVSAYQVGLIGDDKLTEIHHFSKISDVYVALDHSFVVTRDDSSRAIKILNLKDPSQAPIVLSHESRIRDVEIAPDASFVLTVSDNEKKVWFLSEARQLAGVPLVLDHDIYRGGLCRVSNSIIAIASGALVNIYYLNKEHKAVARRARVRHETWVNSIDISPDNSFIFTVMHNRKFSLFKLNKSGSIEASVRVGSIVSAAIARNSSFVVVEDARGNIGLIKCKLKDRPRMLLKAKDGDWGGAFHISADSSSVIMTTNSHCDRCEMAKLDSMGRVKKTGSYSFRWDALGDEQLASDHSFLILPTSDRKARIVGIDKNCQQKEKKRLFDGWLYKAGNSLFSCRDMPVQVVSSYDPSICTRDRRGHFIGVSHIWKMARPLVGVDLTIPQILLFLKLAYSENRIDFAEKSSRALYSIYQQLSDEEKKFFNKKNRELPREEEK
jgi:WD40 repeat protein